MRIQKLRLNFKKSDRKNAKHEIKEFIIDENFKLSMRSLYLIVDEIVTKSKSYKNIYITVLINNSATCLKTSKHFSIEQYINDVTFILEFTSGQKFKYNLEEMYNTPSIKYLINKYYSK